jgi:hypothetical protein
MTKLIRISLLVVVVFAIAFALIAAVHNPGPLAATFGGVQPNVGWNKQAEAYVLPSGDAEPNVGWNSKPTAFILPGIKPCIGWNT